MICIEDLIDGGNIYTLTTITRVLVKNLERTKKDRFYRLF
tara:strand:- start:302 stop:421 length:120 start_codon:yes stop_codon:yes gene_type:complete